MNNDKEEQEKARTKFATSVENHINKMSHSGREKYIINTVERTKKFLNANKNIYILNADKGNVTVAMEKEEYKERMLKIVGDMMTYQRVNKDPTQALQKRNNELVEELFKNNIISEAEKKNLKADNVIAPRLYGLPKIHKEGYPLRPICSSVKSPSSEMCKYVADILKCLTVKSRYNVRDSVQFRDRIKHLTIQKDEKLISFDVVSLFPSVPVDAALQIIEERWNEITVHTNMTKHLFMKILRFCIVDNRYFKYDVKIYRQKKGLPMGSPASPVIADILMEKLLDTSMDKLKEKPKIMTKYVDDLFAILKEDEIDNTLKCLNEFHKSISFTMEIETDNKLPYLDILLIKENGKLITDWYQKDTASGRIMNFFSNHPRSMLINTAKNLVNRVLTISDNKFHKNNRKKLQNILQENNFPPKLIKELISSYKPYLDKENIEKEPKIYRSLSYVKGISERITNSNIVDKNKVNIAHKNYNTLKNIFTKTKDKTPIMETSNVIYQITCNGDNKEPCDKMYIGTTKNKLKTRLSGHKSDIKLRNNNKLQKTALATHCATTKHHPNFDDVRVLERESSNSKRLTLEMLYINNVPTEKRMNYKSDTDNIAHIYRHIIDKTTRYASTQHQRKQEGNQCNKKTNLISRIEDFGIKIIQYHWKSSQEKSQFGAVLGACGMIEPYFFKDDTNRNVTVNGECFHDKLSNFVLPNMQELDVGFPQDDDTCPVMPIRLALAKWCGWSEKLEKQISLFYVVNVFPNDKPSNKRMKNTNNIKRYGQYEYGDNVDVVFGTEVIRNQTNHTIEMKKKGK
ncbi:uncharacterized protein LOC142231485 [Haematobia irritans]|uniref:uncharacterized protein LOC142231485 n=1 Tax=Haematobia irritans TaxID=7368 RepID=UPI003F500E97